MNSNEFSLKIIKKNKTIKRFLKNLQHSIPIELLNIVKDSLNSSSKILTNRELLSFRTVFAFPKASRIGLVWTTWSSKEALPFDAFPVAPTHAKYPITFLVFSVFPAPDSPLKYLKK